MDFDIYFADFLLFYILEAQNGFFKKPFDMYIALRILSVSSKNKSLPANPTYKPCSLTFFTHFFHFFY